MKILAYSVIGLFLTIVLLVLYFAVSPNYVLLTAKSNNMKPTFEKGDVIILESRKAGDIKPGEIIAFTYRDPQKGQTITTGRVASLEDNSFMARGDAENGDPIRVSSLQVKGKYLFKMPFIGRIEQFLAGGNGRVVAGSFLLFTVVIGGLLRLVRRQRGGQPSTST